MSVARKWHTATGVGGEVLLAGGYNGSGDTNSADIYFDSLKKCASTGAMATAREVHTAAALSNGKVLVAGSIGNSGFLKGAELFDPAKGTWSAAGAMATARLRHTATLLSNGQVLVAGGEGNGNII